MIRGERTANNNVTWKDYVDTRFEAYDKAVQAALISAEKRLDGMNEFRGQLTDQTKTFIPRNEYSVQHANLEDRLTTLTDRFNKLEGSRSGVSGSWTILVTIASLLISATLVIYTIIRGK
jgi:hypothetical protein